MHDEQCVYVASGEMEAQQIHAFLEAAGIPAAFRGEALRNTHGLTIDGLGRVEILVRDVDAARATQLLSDADAGRFRV
jgi:hypothetical protein